MAQAEVVPVGMSVVPPLNAVKVLELME